MRPNWYAIGAYHPKRDSNMGGMMRSAVSLGATYTFTIGRRYSTECSDTVKSHRHIPIFHYQDATDFREARPFNVPLIGVELTPDAEPLELFTHPPQAVYILGPEDGSLPAEILESCQHIVSFNSKWCLNLASAATVTMYDRRQKEMNATTRPPVQLR